MKSKGCRIVLIGFMGSGKTTVGKLLARKLNMSFFDIDDMIREAAGESIGDIFRYRGEAVFRELEKQSAVKASTFENCVIATGGGTLTNAESAKTLKSCGIAVYLHCSADTVYLRTENDGVDRPLLNGTNKKQLIGALLKSREETYKTYCDIVEENDDITAEECADNIIKDLRQINIL